MSVPALVSEDTFNAVQGLLQGRNPKRMPPRVANGPTLLAGIARCASCGSALVQNTGKSGAYRYYCCSKRMKEGTLDCKGIRIRMDALDDIVVRQVAERVLEPLHLRELLEGYLRPRPRARKRHRPRWLGFAISTRRPKRPWRGFWGSWRRG